MLIFPSLVNLHETVTFNFRHSFYAAIKSVILFMPIFGVIMSDAIAQTAHELKKSGVVLTGGTEPSSAADDILHVLSARAVAAGRSGCAFKRSEITVSALRDDGWTGNPSSAEDCLANLQRKAKDGQILELYRDWNYASNDQVEGLPTRMAAAALKTPGKTFFQYVFPNEKVVGVPSGLALDAGYTSARQAGDAAYPTPLDNAANLPQLAQQCFAQQGAVDKCALVGYALGKRDHLASKIFAAR